MKHIYLTNQFDLLAKKSYKIKFKLLYYTLATYVTKYIWTSLHFKELNDNFCKPNRIISDFTDVPK